MSDQPETTTTEDTVELSPLDQAYAELETAQAEIAEAKAKYLRLYADFENYKKRMTGELESHSRSGKFSVIRGMLATTDDLERALQFANAKPEDLIPGIKGVLDNFVKNLANLGVEPVAGEGSEFDPNLHEAIGQLEGPDNVVVKVLQSGYKMGEHLVRPALVMVGNGS